MSATAFPMLVSINGERYYVSDHKDLENGVFDAVSFPKGNLAQAALLGKYSQEVYGTDDNVYTEEIGKAITQDFVDWLMEALEYDSPSCSGWYDDFEQLGMPEKFAPLIPRDTYVTRLFPPYTGGEEVGYKDRYGLHLMGKKLGDLINDCLWEERLIKSIEDYLDECPRVMEYLHFTDGLSALNACALLISGDKARMKLAEEMNLSKENLGLSKWLEITGSTIGVSGRTDEDVRDYCRYPALISVYLDAVFVAAEEDFDAVSDVLWDNRDEDGMRKLFGPECHDRDFGEEYEHELYERSLDYVNEASRELSRALGFLGESQQGKPSGEYPTDTADYEINRALGIPEEYDMALPIRGLWQPAELAFTPNARLYFADEKKREIKLPLKGFIARYVSDEEIIKAVKEFRDTHSDIPMREKFASVTSDPYSGIDALNMLALLYDSREVAALALVDAAAKRGITITGVAFR